MEKPKHHIFICSSSRVVGEPIGSCGRRGIGDLIQYLQAEVDDRGIEGVMITNTGCMKVCDRGPVLVIYPEGHWYGNLDEEAIDQILDALEAGEVAEEYILT
ncbi:MAG TPA: (2Fe-2S) ferredoxin domain-containing protein [Bacillota bacterium]|jgi:(2Fe-2S) ferredoxin|nr:(2Fe-2S) ferredoxin domain-containing protein [Bacillota bacterium]HOL09671.1 (2Fe-2S) ferredoxin domain-containing protein [Bacillota bacterium]HPO97523.1 (2Fe-2S) ferredoxin domain-containing protein [Bacillota bacterium]